LLQWNIPKFTSSIMVKKATAAKEEMGCRQWWLDASEKSVENL
jgi:hypothetical protein